MYCIKCGKKLIEYDKFCDRCGQKISESKVDTKETDRIDLPRSNLTKEFNFKKQFLFWFIPSSLILLDVFYLASSDIFISLTCSIIAGGVFAFLITQIRGGNYQPKKEKITNKNHAYQENQITSIFSKMPKIVSLILIFVIINGFLWGAQELYHYNDNKKLDDIKMEINRLDSYKDNFERNMEYYGTTKDSYNIYTKAVDDRNKLVDEYNKLAKDTGSRWYLIPIPFGRSKAIK